MKSLTELNEEAEAIGRNAFVVLKDDGEVDIVLSSEEVVVNPTATCPCRFDGDATILLIGLRAPWQLVKQSILRYVGSDDSLLCMGRCLLGQLILKPLTAV
ncbi:MAG: hypothetical protein WC761_02380 [Candidatus Paceibacterota bacterium]|jgi:hypothetical protein